MQPSASVDPITGLSAARFGIYVHFPYCLSKCPYCDFASTVAKQIPEERYARAIAAELALRLDRLPQLRGRVVESIFLGGGTPSLWHPRHVASVLEVLGNAFQLAPRAEVTLEANPGASDVARFADFRAVGINRLSIGVQSFQPSTLAALGRAHDGALAETAFRAAREAGFGNVSMDFIYGVHGQTLAQVESDARRAVSLGPDHLSAYALTLEREALAEEVPLARQLSRGEVTLPPDEAVVGMGAAVRRIYGEAGLARYEISNYARPGYHSRHNSLYWTGGEYLALGTGATGFLLDTQVPTGGERYSNHRSAEKYLATVEAGQLPVVTPERLDGDDLRAERLAMGLRLTAGVDLALVAQRFPSGKVVPAAEVERLVKLGLARRDGARLALTELGADLHSEIAIRLM
ncbi:MAG: radical SAM family heme chaperone HemW [Myxococcota bacterium]|nr:radical SAM family heme chaperone HemW [Myxococcota bacterium]